MDWHVILARPVEEVFACLADPSRLSEWLPGLTASPAGTAVQAELGAAVTSPSTAPTARRPRSPR